MEYHFKIEEMRIMVIDDHEQIRKGVTRVLEKMKVRSITAFSDGEGAIEALESQPVDLILCDLYMRRVSGYKVLEYIRGRAISNDVPVIVVTGEGSREEIVKASDMGADGYLLKPFQPEDLEKKVLTTLNKYFAPSSLAAALRKAEQLAFAKNFDEALVAIEEALKVDSTSVRGRHIKAIILDKLKKTDAAAELFKQNIAQNPDYYRSYAYLGDIYFRAKNFPSAAQMMSKELELNTKQPERQIQLAKLLMSLGQMKEAIDHFRAALRIDGKLPEALLGAGKAYAKIDNFEKAMYYFKRLRRHHPGSTTALEAMVRCALDAGQPKSAELALRNEKSRYRDRYDTYVILSKLYTALEQFDDAKKTINELIEKNPDYIQGYFVKAALHAKLNEFKEALEAYKTIIEMKPDPTSYAKLVETLIKVGNHHEAIRYVHKATIFRRNKADIFVDLLSLYLKTEQYTIAHYVLLRLQKMGVMTKDMEASTLGINTALQNRLGRLKKLAS